MRQELAFVQPPTVDSIGLIINADAPLESLESAGSGGVASFELWEAPDVINVQLVRALCLSCLVACAVGVFVLRSRARAGRRSGKHVASDGHRLRRSFGERHRIDAVSFFLRPIGRHPCPRASVFQERAVDVVRRRFADVIASPVMGRCRRAVGSSR